MGIQGALYSGVSGMNVNSTSMEVIGNNIANSNTYGYKVSRVVFSDALNNAVSSSSGTAQVGSGAMLSSVDSVFGQGTFEATTSNTDLALQGDGFFIVKHPDSGAINYTRAGAFRVQNGGLTNPEGYVVQGYALPGGTSLRDIALNIGDDYPDWEPEYTAEEAEALRDTADIVDSWAGVAEEAVEDDATPDSVVKELSDAGAPKYLQTAAETAAKEEGATAESVAAAIRAIADEADAKATEAEIASGETAPKLESVSVSNEGIVTGVYTDGTTLDMYTVGVAKFNNPSGLTKEGNSMFSASSSSGDPVLGIVSEIGGTIYSSTLEMSNVDLGQEFVKMITTQRGFQASSKIITTTDELLNEVINLKR